MRLDRREDGQCDVYDDSGRLLGSGLSPALAARWSAMRHVQTRVTAQVSEQITARAAAAGVSVSAYVAEVLRQHVDGDDLSFAARATGLAAAGEATRSFVSQAGVAGRERKPPAKKVATTRRRK